MDFKTLIVKEEQHCLTLTLNRIQHKNSINRQLLHEINAALDYSMTKPFCRVIIIQGQQELFCTGLDYNDLITIGSAPERDKMHDWAKLYMATLKRFTTIPKLILSRVEGKVIAGGNGLVAASDIAIATDAAQFKLSEAIWGLIPAMIAPFLIRRIGFQKTYKMTLATNTISPKEAKEIDLIDEHTNDPDAYIQDIIRRISRIDEEVVKEIKSYFRKMWIITDEMEREAIEKTTEMFLTPRVQTNVRAFLETGKL